VTKYYEVNVLLYPYTHKDLDSMPEILREYIEAVLIYFDASDRSFLTALDKYATFVEDNEIELGVLLCKELFDHEKDGITYREAKQHFKLLDVIELDRKHSTEDDDDDVEEVGVQGSTSHHDPVGYDELLQALRSFLWSNVNTGAMGPDRRGSKKHSISVPNDKGNAATDAPVDEKDVEAELANFEKLLTQLITFRPNSQNWSRNERLAAAQEFAEIFEDLIDGDGEKA
jgi:alpha- and gamma-adaptin-binding protein p34